VASGDITEPVSRVWSGIDMVAEIARILREQPLRKEALTRMLAHIAGIVPLDAATLYLYDRERDRLDKIASHGAATDLLEFVHFKSGQGLSGWVAGQKEPIVIQGRDPAIDHVRRSHDSVMILPLLVMNDLIGVLGCSRHERQAFDENRQKLMEIIADQTAVSLERIIYQRELEMKNQALQKAQDELKNIRTQANAPEKLSAAARLAASVNDEIRKPLSVIIGNAQMIELEADDQPDNLIKRTRAIIESTNRISLITHKLSQIDRLVTGNYSADQNSAELNINKSAGGHE